MIAGRREGRGGGMDVYDEIGYDLFFWGLVLWCVVGMGCMDKVWA